MTLRQDARIIGSICYAHACAHFYNLLLPVLFPAIRNATGYSWQELGLLMTVYFLVSGVAQTLAGVLVDRYGARRVLLGGLALLCASALWLAQANSWGALLFGAILAGLGNSVFHPADFALLNHCISPARLGHAFSMHGLAGHIGWVAAPLYLLGIAHFAGWHAAMLGAALLPALAMLLLAQGTPAPQPGPGKQCAGPAMRSLLRQPALWASFLFFLVSALALGGVQNFLAPVMHQIHHISLLAASTGLSVFMSGSACGMLAGGFLAAREQGHERIIAMAFGLAGLLALLLSWRGLPALTLFPVLFLMGLCSGSAGPARDFLIRRSAPAQAIGRVYGLVYGGLELGFALAPLLFAGLLDHGRAGMVLLGIGLCQWLAIGAAWLTSGQRLRLPAAA
ncbi:MFS transporter [Massilia sp. W12]|uniref:MFS transporter n=1 Tax=Massilia sp. W12 TaxID=3126507 RepID=UPI0030D58957